MHKTNKKSIIYALFNRWRVLLVDVVIIIIYNPNYFNKLIFDSCFWINLYF